MSHEKKVWSPAMDINAKKKFCLAVRMVEDGALEAFEDVSLNNETYARNFVLCMVSGDDVVGVKAIAQFSSLDQIRQLGDIN